MTQVAVTGFGVVSPIGVGRESFWDSLALGTGGIGGITRFDCSTFEVRLAGEVKQPIELPEEVARWAQVDVKIGFGYAAALEALQQAGRDRLGPDSLLHLGVSIEAFDPAHVIVGGKVDFGAASERSLGGEGNSLQVPLDQCTALVTARHGRPGRALTNCSACAAGAQAVGHGFREVRAGRCDFALCGGLDSMVNPLGVGGFQRLGALTTDNERGESACRPFDASRSGTVLAEGAGVVALEPLEKAQAEGKRILAEVCGYGSTLDAHSLSAPDPEGDGAARAMAAALDDAGLPPDAIGHINAHGTGTALNDEVEARAVRRIFSGCWERVPVSATKSLTGHMIAAAGAVELGACLLALSRSALPANPFLYKVGRGCELAHVTARGSRFEGEYALTNSFGFGGQNASLVLRRHSG
ncbi:MAG: beta-ketoacyl-[acyl-carrier-protein] synthase family protein [Armatimonadota bacterium]